MGKEKLMMKKGELYIVISIIVISLTILLYMNYGIAHEGNMLVKISVANEIVLSKEINSHTQETIAIPLLSGEMATVIIEHGQVKVLPLPDNICPKGICSHTGWIQRAGEAIICLPNQLVISLHYVN